MKPKQPRWIFIEELKLSLFNAIKNNDLSRIRLIFSQHPKLLTITYLYGRTILHIAAEKGQPKVIKLLIEEYKLEKEAKDINGWTALHTAAAKAHLDVIKLLINEYKLEREAKDNNGYTALHLAAKYGRQEQDIIEPSFMQYKRASLIDTFGLNITVQNGHLDFIPYISVQNSHFGVIKFLIEECKLEKEAKGNNGRTALHFAAVNGHLDVIKLLLGKYKVEKEAKDNSGRTALHLATDKSHLDVIKLLIEVYKLEREAKDNYGWTALHVAASNGNLGIIKLLIEEYKLEKKTKDTYGVMPFHLAIGHGDLSAVQLLVGKKESEDSLGEQGIYIDEKVLHIAAFNNIDNPAMLSFFFNNAQNLPSLISEGGEASELAIRLKEAAINKGNRRIITFLEEKISTLQETITTVSTIAQQRNDQQKELASALKDAKEKYENPLHQGNKDFRDNLYQAYMDYAAFELLPRGNYIQASTLLSHAIKPTKNGFKELLVGSNDKGALAYILAGFVENAKAEEEKKQGDATKEQKYYGHANKCFEIAAAKLGDEEHPLLFIGQAVTLVGEGQLDEAVALRNKVTLLLEECLIWVESGSIVEKLCETTIHYIDQEERLTRGAEEHARLREQSSKEMVTQQIQKFLQDWQANDFPPNKSITPRTKRPRQNPSCFIVYAHHEQKDHPNMGTVRQLIADLKNRNISVKSDRDEEWPSKGIITHSQCYIDPDSNDAVDYVIIALSKQLVLKADDEKTILHEEMLMIKNRLQKEGGEGVILIQLEEGEGQNLRDVCPDIFWKEGLGLRDRVDHLRITDFTPKGNYQKGFEKLYGALHGKRVIEPGSTPANLCADHAGIEKTAYLKVSI